MKVYAVFYEHGDYDDYREYIVKVFDSPEKATAFVDTANCIVNAWAKSALAKGYYWAEKSYLDILQNLTDMCDCEIIDLDCSRHAPFSVDLDGHEVN